MSFASKLVLSFRVVSANSLSLMISIACLMGVFVNKDTTSWELKISSSVSLTPSIYSARCFEFLT